jgi:predicted glycoside hydrolase/deacetylase ChbG (UPF0249 family)
MKKFLFVLAALSYITLQAQNEIRLLVRGDDIGSFHSANLACIDSYKKGVMQSVEIMPCCSWTPEAITLLNENPGLDVGVHLMVTSEWTTCKWSPLTKAPSLTDENGYFHPFIWANEARPGMAIMEYDWQLSEIEQEFRAQIELIKKQVPNVSHLSGHMGSSAFDPKIAEMTKRLAKEYGLEVESDGKFERFPQFQTKGMTAKQRVDAFAKAIESLQPGTYLFVEHPAYNTPEMTTVGHPGYENVAEDRQAVVEMFTSPKVKKVIEKKNIKLISYKDLK